MPGVKRILPLVSAGLAMLAAALYLAAVALAGGNPLGAPAYALAFGLCVWLPGAALCAVLLPGVHGAARLALAVPLGACLLMLCHAVLGGFAVPVLSAAPCVLLGLGWLVLRGRGGWRPSRPRLRAIPPAAWGLLLVFSLALVLYLFTGVFRYAWPSAAGGSMVYNQDMLWSAGNAAAAQGGLPLADLRAVGGELHYHYFADAIVGLLAACSGQSAYEAMCWFSWPVWCAALLPAAYAAARVLGAGRRASLAVGAALLFGACLWQQGFIHLFVNMNGVLPALLFFICALLAVQAGLNLPLWRTLPAFAMVFAALAWTKSTIGVLFFCALAAAVLVRSLCARKAQWRAFALLGAGGAVLLALYLCILRFAHNNLVFQPRAFGPAQAGHALLHCLPVAVLYLLSLVISLRCFVHLEIPSLLLNAVVPGGLLAYVLFTHYSASQNYFLIFALYAACLCGARAADWLLDAKRKPRGTLPGTGRVVRALPKLALAVLAVAAVAGTAVSAEPVARAGVQAALRCVGLRPPFAQAQHSISADDEAAARWLRANLSGDGVFATNRNAQDAAVGEGVFHYMTAVSERQAFVESWRYAMDYSMNYDVLRHNLEQVSDVLYCQTTFKAAAAIAADNGITHIVLYLPLRAGPWPDKTPAFSSETVWIYEVDDDNQL